MPKRRDENAPFWVQMREAERRILEYALEHGKTLKKTASLLGISPNYLSERTRELGIAVTNSRPGPKPGTQPKRRKAAAPESAEDVRDDEDTRDTDTGLEDADLKGSGNEESGDEESGDEGDEGTEDESEGYEDDGEGDDGEGFDDEDFDDDIPVH